MNPNLVSPYPSCTRKDQFVILIRCDMRKKKCKKRTRKHQHMENESYWPIQMDLLKKVLIIIITKKNHPYFTHFFHCCKLWVDMNWIPMRAILLPLWITTQKLNLWVYFSWTFFFPTYVAFVVQVTSKKAP